MDDSTSRKETGTQLSFYFSEMVFPLTKGRTAIVARLELTYYSFETKPPRQERVPKWLPRTAKSPGRRIVDERGKQTLENEALDDLPNLAPKPRLL